SEAEESQPLGSRVPIMSEEFEASDPSVRVAEVMALSDSAFCKRYRSSYETPSPSLTLPVRKRYREDEGPGLEGKEKEAVPEGQQQAVHFMDTVMNEPLGLGYAVARRRALESTEEIAPSTFEVDLEDGRVYIDILTYTPLVTPIQTPPSPECSSGSLATSPSSLVVPSPIALLVATLITTISVDEDKFLEVGAKLELYGSILHDHTQRLDALSPTLFADIDRDVRELYTRSRAVRYEIFLQRTHTSWMTEPTEYNNRGTRCRQMFEEFVEASRIGSYPDTRPICNPKGEIPLKGLDYDDRSVYVVVLMCSGKFSCVSQESSRSEYR
nr:hypothetical protein [Tanacetum cinerariifolium]